MRIRTLTLALCLAGGSWPAAATELSLDAVPICYNFGCNVRQAIHISPIEWSEVRSYFFPAARDAAEERGQIQRATGWLEVIAGRHTPIHLDRGQNNLDSGSHGQMDCIDESKNMHTYLQLLEHGKLLRFHKVLDRAYRKTMWDQHWAGQIQEFATGQRWVVDSWFHDYGHLPYVQKTEEWLDIPFFFSSYLDNSPD